MSTLDNLKKEAKRWFKALRTGDSSARERLLRAYPDAPATPTLRDIQHALAREHHADNWVAFKATLAAQALATSDQPDANLVALLAACDQADVDRARGLLDATPDLVNRRGVLDGHSGLRTALHFGVHHDDIVRLLLDRGANPNIRDEGDNAMPLHFAVERGNMRVIRQLIERGADPIGSGDGHELEVIGWATCFGDGNIEMVEYLLAHGARHNIMSATATGAVDAIRTIASDAPRELARHMDRTNHRRTPLHLAVVKKQRAALDTLIECGVELDAVDAAGLTPLDQAALSQEREMAQTLINRGATVGLPAMVALGRTDDLERALAADPDCLRPGNRWQHLLVRAAEAASGDVVETLLRHGAAIDKFDDGTTSIDSVNGYTALHAAAFAGNMDAARVLLTHGADVTIRDDRYCSTAAGWAAYAKHTEVRDLILEGPIDIFQAIEFDRVERIDDILTRDPGAISRTFKTYAPRCARDESGTPSPEATPLAWAVQEKKVAAAQALIALGASLPPSPRAVDDESHSARVAQFLRYACWDHHVHGKSDHRMYDRAAQRLLQQHPEIAADSIYTAVVCGDVESVRRALTANPHLANEAGGERGWPPLLYLCFARFSHEPSARHAVEIAQLLLAHGADANAYYKAGDSNYTALVGVAGEGEQDAPRQPSAPALFELLLEHDAHPFDIQVLYNTHFSGDMIWWLDLVYRHTMSHGSTAVWADPDWAMLDMGGYGPGAYFILNTALKNNLTDLAEWALRHGAGPDARTSTHPKFKPKHSLYEQAMLEGATEIAELLAQFGASRSQPSLSDEESYVALCLQFDRAAVQQQLEKHPEYLESPHAIFTAARRDRADVVAFLLDLGMSIEIESAHKERLLHAAAGHGALRVARLLIERGAEIDPRESRWHATPIGFASYGERLEMLDLLSQVSTDVWTLAFRGYVDRLREIIEREPALARVTNSDGTTPLWWLPDDEEKALAIATLLLAHGADPAKRSREGSTAGGWARKRGMLELAALLGADGAGTEPLQPSLPGLETFEQLAKALTFAFETGHPSSMQQLQEYYGHAFTWEQLRASVRGLLDALGTDRPDGYFALPHARLLIARQAGFADWTALAASLDAAGNAPGQA